MAKGRSPSQRLIDNAQRRIRHINAKLNDPNKSGLVKAGLERNKERLKDFVDDIKEQAKTGKLDINEKALELKENASLSANEREINKITKKMMFGESDEEWENMGSNPMFDDIFHDYADVVNIYIGESGRDGEAREKASNVVEKIKDVLEKNQNKISFSDQTRLLQMQQNIESRLTERGYAKGLLRLHPLNK